MISKNDKPADILEFQREYFLDGNTLPLKNRKLALQTLKALLKKNEGLIAEAVFKDFRKSYYEVIENEISLVYVEISLALRKMKRWNRPWRPLTSIVNMPGQSRVYPIPYGNTLIIGAWNYPVQLALIPLVNALAAGNTAIVKPSEQTPHTSALLAQLLNSAFNKELVFVQEGGIEISQELLKLKFDKIFFTGSTRVGKIVMKAAAENLTPVTLELGGKNPVIVLPDCNIKRTAQRLVWGKFHNGGQACVAPDHIYVHDSIADALLEEIKRYIHKIYKENSMESEAYPRLINEQAFDRIMGLIDPDKVLIGGKSDRKEKFIEPTVLGDVKKEDAIMQEEIFGPLMPILRFSDTEELVRQLNHEASPLAVYIFSKAISRAKALHKRLRSGGGMINDVVVHFVNSSTPFGGFGSSGMGSYHGKAGFECFSHRKTVLKKPLWFELWAKYEPYTKVKLKVIRLLLK